MSLVHTNKTLQRLAATRTVRWKDRRFEILDREALVKIARYEPPGAGALPVHLSRGPDIIHADCQNFNGAGGVLLV